MEQLTITHPDDWHIHLRDNAALKTTVTHCAAQFKRAIIMPNLQPPVITTEDALTYRQRITAATPQRSGFEPLMTLYLTDNTTPDEIRRAKASGQIFGIKLYPAGATTNSDAGVTQLEKVYPTLETMAELGLPLLIHGELTQSDIDIFDREKMFIEQQLAPLTERFSKLKIVFEHITTADAVQFVFDTTEQIGATITPHHLLLNRNDLLVGGLRPHHFCLPVLKRERHRRALLEAIASGSKKFFLGSDSAPHPRHAKESACGCAGIYSAFAAIELYAEAFESIDALDRLDAFAGHHGPDFYGLPRNSGKITLIRKKQPVPSMFEFAGETVIPLRAGGELQWQVIKENLDDH